MCVRVCVCVRVRVSCVCVCVRAMQEITPEMRNLLESERYLSVAQSDVDVKHYKSI